MLFLMFFMSVSFSVMANDEALSRAQYMIRQMNAELNQLKSTHQNLLAEKTARDKDYDVLKKKYDKLQIRTDKNKKAMKGQVLDVKQKFKAELSAHTETRKLFSAITEEKNRLFEIATNQMQAIDQCVGNNKKLFNINIELLSIYEKKGVWDSLTQAEPFSGLSQVEIENLIDDYQYKLEDLRVEANL